MDDPKPARYQYHRLDHAYKEKTDSRPMNRQYAPPALIWMVPRDASGMLPPGSAGVLKPHKLSDNQYQDKANSLRQTLSVNNDLLRLVIGHSIWSTCCPGFGNLDVRSQSIRPCSKVDGISRYSTVFKISATSHKLSIRSQEYTRIDSLLNSLKRCS